MQAHANVETDDKLRCVEFPLGPNSVACTRQFIRWGIFFWCDHTDGSRPSLRNHSSRFHHRRLHLHNSNNPPRKLKTNACGAAQRHRNKNLVPQSDTFLGPALPARGRDSHQDPSLDAAFSIQPFSVTMRRTMMKAKTRATKMTTKMMRISMKITRVNRWTMMNIGGFRADVRNGSMIAAMKQMNCS